jgi:hypothetical protein
MSVNRRELIAEWWLDFEALLNCVTDARRACAPRLANIASTARPINPSSSG